MLKAFVRPLGRHFKPLLYSDTLYGMRKITNNCFTCIRIVRVLHNENTYFRKMSRLHILTMLQLTINATSFPPLHMVKITAEVTRCTEIHGDDASQKMSEQTRRIFNNNFLIIYVFFFSKIEISHAGFEFKLFGWLRKQSYR